MVKMQETLKMVIVVRSDLDMGRGKIAAQVAHAAVSAALQAREQRRRDFDRWLAHGQMKVVVKVSGLEELLALKGTAESKRILTAAVEDRGLTQVDPGTVTCLGLGPASEPILDQVTGRLKLL